jgi:hypothetical protein
MTPETSLKHQVYTTRSYAMLVAESRSISLLDFEISREKKRGWFLKDPLKISHLERRLQEKISDFKYEAERHERVEASGDLVLSSEGQYVSISGKIRGSDMYMQARLIPQGIEVTRGEVCGRKIKRKQAQKLWDRWGTIVVHREQVTRNLHAPIDEPIW